MSDLDKTVDFIKEIEKLKSVTRFNRTLEPSETHCNSYGWHTFK